MALKTEPGESISFCGFLLGRSFVREHFTIRYSFTSYHCPNLFDHFGVSSFGSLKLSTDLLVWSNPNNNTSPFEVSVLVHEV